MSLDMATKNIALDLIRIDGGTQPRAELNQDVIQDYAQDMLLDVVFPAIILFYDGSDYWLADGFHRYHAAKQICREAIDADVRQGTRRDAVLYSVGTNSAHGLRRTNADKRQAIKTLLRDEEWVKWSDSEIARRTSTSHTLVGQLRNLTCNIASEDRTYITKYGTEATMNTVNIGQQPTQTIVTTSIRTVPAYYEDEETGYEPAEPLGEEEEEIPHYQLPITELYREDVLREAIEKMEEVAPVTFAREETAPQISLPIEEDIKEKRDAHVMRVMGSSDSPEWYTPQGIIDLVCRMFGEIDTDPCSNSHEAPTVPARTLYTKDDDGLAYTWTGKTYLNPPYGTEISKWTDKLIADYRDGHVEEALALLPARIDTVWFSPLYEYLICNVRGRLQFANSPYNAPFPCVVVYLGTRYEAFIETFKTIGPIMKRIG